MLAMGLRNLGLSIETTEVKGFFVFFLFFLDENFSCLLIELLRPPFSISSSLTTPDDEIRIPF